MYLCVCEIAEPQFSLLLLIVLHALLPKGSNNTNLLHAQCLSLSLSLSLYFCLSFTLSVTPLTTATTLPSLSASIGPECFGVWVLCEGSCESKGRLHALTKHLWVSSATLYVFVFTLNHGTARLSVYMFVPHSTGYLLQLQSRLCHFLKVYNQGPIFCSICDLKQTNKKTSC